MSSDFSLPCRHLNEYSIMQSASILPLTVFCMALSVGCAQLQPARAPVASVGASQPAAGESRVAGARLDARWLSAVVGMPVESSAGATLGRVQDVIVDGYGRPAFAIVSYGGVVVGLGAKYAAIPWETVAEMLDRDKLMVNQPILEKAPTLSGAGADARSGEWRRDAALYWHGKVASAE
jgi:sporulation protein YlmC with PRC-barrel domain